ncbi:MAG: BMP family ABC transporter substrate-binding protein [Anaerolineaceae bacterium]
MFHQQRTHKITLRHLILGVTVILLILLFALPQAGQASYPKSIINIGLIPDVGGIDDASFNEMAAAGLAQAETDFGVIGTVYPTSVVEDYPDKIAECVAAGNALCITVGYSMMDATLSAANANPGVNFATVDASWEIYPANLRGITFNSAQAGYLAGTLAGLMSASHVIGAIGGFPIPPVDHFMVPYQYGAQWADPQVQVLLEYAYNFGDPDLGAQMAQDQIARGADVIFAVAGPTGNGVNLATAMAGKWTIGVDVDVYYTIFGGGTVDGHEYLLTSAMKRVDMAVYHTIEDIVDATFASGTMVNDLANEGVGLAPYHDAAASVPQDVQDQVTAVAQSILNGGVDVWEPFYKYSIALPIVIK